MMNRKGDAMAFKIPKPITLEHEELHAKLVRAIREGGKIGYAAQVVAKILHPHFVKEEEYALPPLGLLTALAKGKITKEMCNVLMMTERLKKDLGKMLKEHKSIVSALKEFIKVAKREKKAEYVHFAQKLILHARTEEEVLYPTALLIGEYIKSKSKK
jgi:hypothetical protein